MGYSYYKPGIFCCQAFFEKISYFFIFHSVIFENLCYNERVRQCSLIKQQQPYMEG